VLLPPQRITSAHDLSKFESGEPDLDNWLMRRALANEVAHASRTYVVCDGTRVVGFYSLANGAVQRSIAPKPVSRNMPDPIPAMVLGRLAVDRDYQGKGIGGALLADALKRVLQAADIAGIKLVLVHAISEDARRFYEAKGFLASPTEPRTLCLPIATIRNVFVKAP
jgi:GNAT superfamily N-acetyltransferase